MLQDKQQTINKMAIVSPSLSANTLKVNEMNSQLKYTEW